MFILKKGKIKDLSNNKYICPREYVLALIVEKRHEEKHFITVAIRNKQDMPGKYTSTIYKVELNSAGEPVITTKPYAQIHVRAHSLNNAINTYNDGPGFPNRRVSRTCSASGKIIDFLIPLNSISR